MNDETNDAPVADVEDGAAEAPIDIAAADAPVTVEDLVAALEAVTAERDQHLADLQRVSAEFQNFRKQTEKRNSDFAAQAGSRVAEALLQAAPTGGRLRVTTDGHVARFSDGQWVTIAIVTADDWFPGHLS